MKFHKICFGIAVFSLFLNGCGTYGDNGFWDDVSWNAIENRCATTPQFEKCVSNETIYFEGNKSQTHISNFNFDLSAKSDEVTSRFLACLEDRGVIRVTENLLKKYRKLVELYVDFTFDCPTEGKICLGVAKGNYLIISVFNAVFITQCHEECHFLGYSHQDFKDPDITYCLASCQWYDGSLTNTRSLEENLPDENTSDLDEDLDDIEKEVICDEISSNERDWNILTPSSCKPQE